MVKSNRSKATGFKKLTPIENWQVKVKQVLLLKKIPALPIHKATKLTPFSAFQYDKNSYTFSFSTPKELPRQRHRNTALLFCMFSCFTPEWEDSKDWWLPLIESFNGEGSIHSTTVRGKKVTLSLAKELITLTIAIIGSESDNSLGKENGNKRNNH